jgi:hypothetical protein
MFNENYLVPRTLCAELNNLPFTCAIHSCTARTVRRNGARTASKCARRDRSPHSVRPHWWPSESPDLNPIECLWHQLKHYLRSKVKPTTKEELIAGIEKFWKEEVTEQLCRKYCEHIYHVAPLVVAAGGGPTLK